MPCIADAFGARPRYKLDKILCSSLHENLLVAPASPRMIDMERNLFRWGHRLQAITRALQPMADEIEALVIDTPTTTQRLFRSGIGRRRRHRSPRARHGPCPAGLDEIHAAHSDVTDNRGGKLAVVVNLWDRRTSATNAAMEEAFADLQIPVAKNRVIRAEALNQAGLAYQLVYDFSPAHEVGENLRQLSKELWKMAE